jgi:hypothetical protein
MEENTNKDLEEAKWQNDAKNEFIKQMDELFKKGFVIGEDGIIKIKTDEIEQPS